MAENNVRSIELKKRSKCEHLKITIDEALWQIECSDCGEIIDPIWYLTGIAKRQQKAVWRVSDLKEQEQKLLNKIRCKCQHCGQITNIGR